MLVLLREAQIHALPSFQSSGIKLKLLNALFTGRHVIVNDQMIDGTSVEKICSIANSGEEWRKEIEKWMQFPFTESQLLQRKELLSSTYSNSKNVSLLNEKLFSYIRNR